MNTDIFEVVRKLNIVEVIKEYIDIEVKQGNEYKALCPFHKDRNLGSFLINSNKGMFKCFSCGKGGDAIEFVRLYKNISALEAAVEIAYVKGLISILEYQNYICGWDTAPYKFRKKNSFARKYKGRNSKYILDEIEFKLDSKGLDRAYNIFLNNLELSERHKKHLIRTRNIPIDIIKKRKYRTYPTYKKIKSIFNRFYMKYDTLDDIFKGVPGFYKKNTGDKWEWRINYNEGILIPIKNAREQIVGLQIRLDKKDKNGIRYYWFSSSSFMYSSNTRFGVSSGTPLDVIYPEERPNNVLFVTEGRFKSEVIAKEINSTCISVQGIGNWNGIEREIYEAEDYLKQKYKRFLGFLRIYIAFDMDIYQNLQKWKQLKNMSDFIRDEFPNKKIYYIEWDSNYKGIDDFMLNNKRNKPEDYGKLFKLVDKEFKNKEKEDKIVIKI